MAILDEVKYLWDEKKYMAGFSLTRTGYKFIYFKKVRENFDCIVCNKNYPKGSRCIGDSYKRICMECAVYWFNNSKEELERIKQTIEESQKELEENKEKWRDELVLKSL